MALRRNFIDDKTDKATCHQLLYKTENLYHAHYTAFAIENQIREIRKDDYPLREKYTETFGNK